MSRGIPKKTTKPIRRTTRMTYKDTGDGFLESSTVVLGSELVVIVIDKENKLYRILDMQTRTLCFNLGQADTVDECKRLARKVLLTAEATIFGEVRGSK